MSIFFQDKKNEMDWLACYIHYVLIIVSKKMGIY